MTIVIAGFVDIDPHAATRRCAGPSPSSPVR